METRKCKNKKCSRHLPDGYKYKYCENCRNKKAKQIKKVGQSIVGVAAVIGSTTLAIIKSRKS